LQAFTVCAFLDCAQICAHLPFFLFLINGPRNRPELVELFEGTGDQKHAYGLCKKIKLADKGVNLERLGRYLKLFTDKVEHCQRPVLTV
jgi:hypothetical protein